MGIGASLLGGPGSYELGTTITIDFESIADCVVQDVDPSIESDTASTSQKLAETGDSTPCYLAYGHLKRTGGKDVPFVVLHSIKCVDGTLYSINQLMEIFSARTLYSVVFFRTGLALELLPSSGSSNKRRRYILNHSGEMRSLVPSHLPCPGKKGWKDMCRTIALDFRMYFAHVWLHAEDSKTPPVGFAPSDGHGVVSSMLYGKLKDDTASTVGGADEVTDLADGEPGPAPASAPAPAPASASATTPSPTAAAAQPTSGYSKHASAASVATVSSREVERQRRRLEQQLARASAASEEAAAAAAAAAHYMGAPAPAAGPSAAHFMPSYPTSSSFMAPPSYGSGWPMPMPMPYHPGAAAASSAAANAAAMHHYALLQQQQQMQAAAFAASYLPPQ